MKQILCDQCGSTITESSLEKPDAEPVSVFSITEEIVGFNFTAEGHEAPDLLIPSRGEFCSPQCVREWLEIHFPGTKH